MKQFEQLDLSLHAFSTLCKQLHSRAMCLFVRLEYEYKSCASCSMRVSERHSAANFKIIWQN